MAEFVKVANEYKRMCESFKLCSKCPLGKEQGLDIQCQCRTWVADHLEKTERIVMQWAAEHPIVTNRRKFAEVFGFDVATMFEVNRGNAEWLDEEYQETK